MAAVEVYADIVCPFAYVGLTRLIERRQSMGRDDVRLRIRAWPLELVNGEPVDGHFIGEEAEDIRPQVAPELFTGFDAAAFPASSLPALALTAAAYDVDDTTGEHVAMELRRLVFEHGRDVADAAVLGEVARQYRVEVPADDARARAEWARGRELGVQGSPHFFVDGTSLFCPVLDIQRRDGALVVHVDDAAFDSFVQRCFG